VIGMKKEKSFKVGERVAVYTSMGRFVRDISDVDIENDGLVHFVSVGKIPTHAHPKQCRRLVKKQRREWKLLYRPCSCRKGYQLMQASHVCKEWFVAGPAPLSDVPITVREVRKGGK